MTQNWAGDAPHPGPILVTRDKRTLDREETEAVIAEARRDGLLVTADRHQLSPGDLYRLCAPKPPRPETAKRQPPPRHQPLPADPWAEVVE
jgi:hypothetical protein